MAITYKISLRRKSFFFQNEYIVENTLKEMFCINNQNFITDTKTIYYIWSIKRWYQQVNR